MKPPDVARGIAAELDSHGVWHRITRNQRSVSSCREAASARHRLGVIGIPLWDELKSHVARYETSTGRRYVAVHCRAHQRRDDEKVDALTGGRTVRLTPDELASELDLDYGLVNPFVLAGHPSVVQLFDEGVLDTYPAPGTMMTNVGDREWAIEFDPSDIVKYLPNAQVADVVSHRADERPANPVLGILTGNGPESGMELWRRINSAVQAGSDPRFLGEMSYPQVVVASVPAMGLSMELPEREDHVREVVLDGVDTLRSAGASVVGIACNTTQYFSADIRQRCDAADITFMSLVDAICARMRLQRVSRFDLVGIGPVVDLHRYSDFRRLADEFDIHVPSDRDIESITGLAWEVKAKADRTSGSSIAKLERLLSSITTSETVLIALTELSVALSEHPKIAARLARDSNKVIVDSLTVLAEAMAETYLSSQARALGHGG